jgi:hypothetical protein
MNAQELALELQLARRMVKRIKDSSMKVPLDVARLVTAFSALDEGGAFAAFDGPRLKVVSQGSADPENLRRDAAVQAHLLVERTGSAMRQEVERKRREDVAKQRAADAAQGIPFDAVVTSTPDISSYSTPSCDTSTGTDCSSS